MVQGKENTLRLATLLGHEPPLEWGKPIVDLNLALNASLRVAKSVLGQKNNIGLQQDLNQTLSEHEKLLKSAETAFADRLVKLVRKRDALRNRKRSSGMVARVRNLFLTVAIGIRNFQISSGIQNYDRQKHLSKVARQYSESTHNISAPHLDWYAFDVPRININVVEKELLSISEIAARFGQEETKIRNLVKENGLSYYEVRNRDLIRTTELRKALSSSS